MTRYRIRKSELLVECEFLHPAFALFRPESELHDFVVAALSDFHPVRSSDIFIEAGNATLADSSFNYKVLPYNCVAKVSLDQAGLQFLNPHTMAVEDISGLSMAVLDAVQSVLVDNPFAEFRICIGVHAELQGVEPVEFTDKFVSPVPEGCGPTLGSAVTHYFGMVGPRIASSIALDMSQELSECVFLGIELTYDGGKSVVSELPGTVIEHCCDLLDLVGLEKAP